MSKAKTKAEEVARGFHGRENRDSFEIEEVERYRENLAYLGEMIELEIFNPLQNRIITLPFEEVMLGVSPDRKSMYFVGDTRIPNDFLESCSNGWVKDKVPLGFVYSISYFADKHHLTGPKQQKKGMEYIHAFGEQTFKAPARFEGIWKLEDKIANGALPQLVYSRLGENLELVGGIYEVRDEGIWD